MGRKAQNHSVALRIQALALFEEGIAVERVKDITGMSRSAIFRLRQTARARGYDPNVSRELKEEYVQDAPRSGRPRKDAKGGVPSEVDNNATMMMMGGQENVSENPAPAMTTMPEMVVATPAEVAVEDALKSAVAVMDAAPAAVVETTTTAAAAATADAHVNGFMAAG